jgi:hypothetical protein
VIHGGGSSRKKNRSAARSHIFVSTPLQKQAFDGAENKKPITFVTGFSFCG